MDKVKKAQNALDQIIGQKVDLSEGLEQAKRDLSQIDAEYERQISAAKTEALKLYDTEFAQSVYSSRAEMEKSLTRLECLEKKATQELWAARLEDAPGEFIECRAVRDLWDEAGRRVTAQQSVVFPVETAKRLLRDGKITLD